MNWMHQVCILQDIGDCFAIRRKLKSIYLPMWGFTKSSVLNNVTWVRIATIFIYWKVHSMKLCFSWWINTLHKVIDVSNRPQVFLTEGAKKINLYFNYPCSNFILRGLPIFFWDKCWCVQMDVKTSHIRFKEMFFPCKTLIVVPD